MDRMPTWKPASISSCSAQKNLHSPTMLSEFSLIERFFARRANAPSPRHQDEAARPLGIGDDCALIAPPAGHQLAISTDMLVEGRHFFADVDPRALGHKALAVNLSDLAAMGAAPHAFTLALALPRADEAWLAAFSDGLFALAERFDCALIGGDTTSGPLNICITVFGDVPHRAALRRDAARPGDDIYVSGRLGDARAGLGAILGEWRAPDDASADTIAAQWRHALEWPEPRVALGQALRGVAHAALDISDGLAGDLMHILRRSNARAVVDADAVPCADALRALPDAARRQCALAGGDDYELCFTAPPSARDALAAIADSVQVPLTRIGRIEAGAPAIDWRDANGAPLSLTLQGFDHFHAD
jgi:thiamine-monophosphate kinase